MTKSQDMRYMLSVFKKRKIQVLMRKRGPGKRPRISYDTSGRQHSWSKETSFKSALKKPKTKTQVISRMYWMKVIYSYF